MSRRNLIKGLTRGKWCHRGHVTQHTKSHTGNESRFIIIIIIIIIIIGSHVPTRNTGQLNKKHVLRDSVPVWPFVRCVTQPLWRPFPRDRLWPSCPYMVSRKWGVFVASTNVLSWGLRSLSKDVLSDAQIQSITVKRLTDTNFVVSRHIKRKKGSLPVDVGHSKKRLCSAQPTSFHVPYSAHSYLICQWEKAYLKLSQFSIRGKSSALTQSISFHQAITNPANMSRVSTQYVVCMPAYESKPLTDRGARLTLLDVFLFPFDLWFSVIITLVACFRLF